MRLFPVLLLVTLGIVPLSAQTPGGFGGTGRRGGGMGGRQMMGQRRPLASPSEDILHGPLPPDSMIPQFALDSAEGLRYRGAWDSMMVATAPRRDSIQQMVADRRRAREEGFQHIGPIQDGEIQKLMKELKDDDARFDKVIRHILTKDQWADFKDWRDRRRRTEREVREQQRLDHPQGGSLRPPGR